MANISGSTGSLPGRLWPPIVAAVVTGLLVFITCFMVWYHLGGGAWRSEVSVSDAKLEAPNTLVLSANSCLGAPRVSSKEETNADVQIEVIAFSTPFHGGLRCQEPVTAYLEEPLGDRTVVDKHTGAIVDVTRQPYTDAQPRRDWPMAEVQGVSGQEGFSLHLPFGWELVELRVNDSSAGEVFGDEGVRLTFDYGKSSWDLDPADDPEHDYFVAYEEIGGLKAKLLISLDATQGYTGVYFPDLGGHELSFVGEDLLPNQIGPAIAVFRSIRLLEK